MDRRRAARTPTTLLAACLICASSPTLAARGEPEPASDDALPRYDEPIPIHIEPPESEQGPLLREVPGDGRGLLAAGGTVTVFAAATLVSAIVLASDSNSLSEDWVPLVVVAAVGTTAGGMLLGWGTPKHREYRKWEAQQPDAIPRRGLGLIGCGSALMVTGMFASVFSGSVWLSETDPLGLQIDSRPERITAAKAGIGLGVSSFVIGTTLLVGGAVRSKRFSVWRRTQTVQLAPALAPTRFGLHVGLGGRF